MAPTEAQAREEPREALMWYLRQVDRAYLRSNAQPQEPLNPTTYEIDVPAQGALRHTGCGGGQIRAWEPLGVTDFCFMTQFGNLSPQKSLASLHCSAKR